MQKLLIIIAILVLLLTACNKQEVVPPLVVFSAESGKSVVQWGETEDSINENNPQEIERLIYCPICNARNFQRLTTNML